MSQAFMGEIRMIGWSWAPRGWATCDGQLLTIQQNTAMFSLLGTTYGGDGRTTFALPDLRGRTPIAAGQGPGLSVYSLGEPAGSETVTLSSKQGPAHQHPMTADTTQLSPDPTNRFIGGGNAMFMPSGDGNSLDPVVISIVGGNGNHNNRQPFLAVYFVICLEGVYPKRP